MYTGKILCRNLIVLAVFLVFVFQYQILWNRFAKLISLRDSSGAYKEPPGVKPQYNPIFLNLTAEKTIIQQQRHFIRVNEIGKKQFLCYIYL